MLALQEGRRVPRKQRQPTLSSAAHSLPGLPALASVGVGGTEMRLEGGNLCPSKARVRVLVLKVISVEVH